uniref:ArdC-like ssDNA-binding domain-containing protein n=1 Tax=Cronobacter malonaticus TaxID=413503 RepID=UPI001F38C168
MDRNNDIYQKVTDQIIAELENGNVPWIRPWRDGEPPFPINALSGRPYHGIKVTFTIYCQPPQGDMKVPVALPLSLNYHGHYVQ